MGRRAPQQLLVIAHDLKPCVLLTGRETVSHTVGRNSLVQLSEPVIHFRATRGAAEQILVHALHPARSGAAVFLDEFRGTEETRLHALVRQAVLHAGDPVSLAAAVRGTPQELLIGIVDDVRVILLTVGQRRGNGGWRGRWHLAIFQRLNGWLVAAAAGTEDAGHFLGRQLFQGRQVFNGNAGTVGCVHESAHVCKDYSGSNNSTVYTDQLGETGKKVWTAPDIPRCRGRRLA